MSNGNIKQNNKYWKNEKPKDRCLYKNKYDKSCFPTDILYRIGKSLKIDGKIKNKTDLINKIKKKLNCNEDIDKCLSKKINKKISLKYLKAEAPEYIWLSNKNIDDVLMNWENKYSNFKSLGATVNDFETAFPEFRNFNIRNYSNKYKKLGMVINTANLNEEGEHWVSLFIHLDKGFIAYFDSTGYLPSEEVFRFMKKVLSQCKNIGLNMNIFINKKEHQKDDGECGVYALNFIVECLNGKNPKRIFDKVIHDNSMSKNRGIFFRSRK
jgi:hypothetical protein